MSNKNIIKLLIVLVIIFGLSYMFMQKNQYLKLASNNKQFESELTQIEDVSESDDLDSIENDVNDTDLDNLDKELSDIDSELEY